MWCYFNSGHPSLRVWLFLLLWFLQNPWDCSGAGAERRSEVLSLAENGRKTKLNILGNWAIVNVSRSFPEKGSRPRFLVLVSPRACPSLVTPTHWGQSCLQNLHIQPQSADTALTSCKFSSQLDSPLGCTLDRGASVFCVVYTDGGEPTPSPEIPCCSSNPHRTHSSRAVRANLLGLSMIQTACCYSTCPTGSPRLI